MAQEADRAADGRISRAVKAAGHEGKRDQLLDLPGTGPADTARTLVVGDSSNDAAAGRAAGCPVVLVTYGYNHGQPIRETPALAWVDAMTDIASALASR